VPTGDVGRFETRPPACRRPARWWSANSSESGRERASSFPMRRLADRVSQSCTRARRTGGVRKPGRWKISIRSFDQLSIAIDAAKVRDAVLTAPSLVCESRYKGLSR